MEGLGTRYTLRKNGTPIVGVAMLIGKHPRRGGAIGEIAAIPRRSRIGHISTAERDASTYLQVSLGNRNHHTRCGGKVIMSSLGK